METCDFYPIFEPNQVLTAEQLNDLATYLEKQERLTRAKLIGVGIVCGLNVRTVLSFSSLNQPFSNGSQPIGAFLPLATFDPAAVREGIAANVAERANLPDIAFFDKRRLLQPPWVEISAGCGITSEGHVIAIESCILTRYRAYVDPANYPLFQIGAAEIELLELLPEVVEQEDERIQRLTADDLQEKAVLLYLECREVDLEACTGDACDEKGRRQEFCLKKLLIKKTDLEKIIKSTHGFPAGSDLQDQLNARFKLPEIAIGRTNDLMSLGEDIQFADIRQHYLARITPILNDLRRALVESFNRYQPILNADFRANPFANAKLFSLFAQTLSTDPCNLQYFYDFLKDLILAYEEFKGAAFELVAECCPNSGLFPKHLMPGEAIATDACEPSVFRQPFIPAPIYDRQHERLAKARMLFKRMVLLVDHFHIPEAAEAEIKITPSNEKNTRLSARAIPYYYAIAPRNPLNEFWNFELARQCRTEFILSYHAGQYSQNSAPAFITSPLKFDLDNCRFLRIEGHIGKHEETVFRTLTDLVRSNNLPVDIVRLKLGTTFDDTEAAFGCEFEDMQLLYVSFRSELICIFEKEIAFFSDLEYTQPPPVYEEEENITGIRGKITDAKGDPLPGVNLTIKELNFLGTASGSNGDYIISSPSTITTGEYTISVVFPGFISQAIKVNLVSNRVLVRNIQLASQGDVIKPRGPLTFPITTAVRIQKVQPSISPGIIKQSPAFSPAIGGKSVASSGVAAVRGNPGIRTTGLSAPAGVIGSGNPAPVAAGKVSITSAGPPATGIQSTAGGGVVPAGKTPVVQDPTATVQGTGAFLRYVQGGQTFRNFTIGQFYNSYVSSKLIFSDMFGFAKDYFRVTGFLDLSDLVGVFDSRIYHAAQVIEKIEDLVEVFTEDLEHFDLDLFEDRYAALIDGVRVYETKINTDLNDPNYVPVGNEQDILDHLRFLQEACSLKQFQSLVEVFRKRVIEIQKLNLFGHFLQKHPGLEHLAGVSKGGTFVFVYDENGKVVADFSLPYICCSNCPPIQFCTTIPIIFKLPREVFCLGEGTAYTFILSPPGGEVTGPGVVRQPQTGGYVFGLASEEVVVGENRFTYRVNNAVHTLTVRVLDLKADFGHEILTIDNRNNLADVKLTALYAGADSYEWDFGDGTAVVIETGAVHVHTFRDLSKQPFTVSLQVKQLACEAVVSKEIPIEACSAKFTSTETVGDTSVEYVLQASQTADTFAWFVTDADGERKVSDQRSLTLSYSRIETAQTIKVRLDITEGDCEASHTEEIIVPPIGAITFDFEEPGKTSFCKGDNTEHKFTVNPPGGVIAGPGVDAARQVFVPANAGDVAVAQLTYTIGTLEPAVLTVRILDPVAGFKVIQPQPTGQPDTYLVKFTNTSQNANTYQWTFNGQVFSNDFEPELLIPNAQPNDEVEVALKTSMDGECDHEVINKFTIPPLPPVSVTFEDLTQTTFCQSDRQAYKLAVNPPGGAVSGPGVDPQTLEFVPANVGATGDIQIVYQIGGRPAAALEVKILTDAKTSFTASAPASTTTPGTYSVTFNNTSQDANTYEWTFQGQVFSADFEPELFIEDAQPGDEHQITLKASINGQCASVFTDTVKIPAAVAPTLVFEDATQTTQFCPDDAAAYKLAATPAGGVLSGPGVDAANMAFVPKNAGTTGKITLGYLITGNPQPAILEVEVLNPVAGVAVKDVAPLNPDIDPSMFSLVLDNSSTNANTFVWSFQDVPFSIAAQPNAIVKDVEPGEGFTLSLKASQNGQCETEAGTDVAIPVNDRRNLKRLTVTPPGGGGGVAIIERDINGNIISNAIAGPANANLKALNDLPNHIQFPQALKPTDAAYLDTQEYFSQVSQDLANARIQAKYLQGAKDRDIAANFQVLFKMIDQKITSFIGRRAKNNRDFVYNIFLLQISELLNLVDIQKSDLQANSPIITTFNDLTTQLTRLKKVPVSIDPEGILTAMHATATLRALKKPRYQNALDNLGQVLG